MRPGRADEIVDIEAREIPDRRPERANSRSDRRGADNRHRCPRPILVSPVTTPNPALRSTGRRRRPPKPRPASPWPHPPGRSRCAACASSPPSAATSTCASRPRPPRSKAWPASRRWPARRGAGYESRAAAGRPCTTACACAAAPTATTRAATGSRRSRPSAATLDAMPANHRHLHWAQLQIYGALLCRARGLTELELALVYFDVATPGRDGARARRRGGRRCEAAFEARCARFLAWAAQEAGAPRGARRRRWRALRFPARRLPPRPARPGRGRVPRRRQRPRACWRRRPTGIGKTLGTLFPLLQAMPGQRLDKVFFLTAKTHRAQSPRWTRWQRLRGSAPGRPLRVLELVARDKACEHPDKACHGDSCPLAQGFYDRLPAARAEAVAGAAGWTSAALRAHRAARTASAPTTWPGAGALGRRGGRRLQLLLRRQRPCCTALTQAHDWRVGAAGGRGAQPGRARARRCTAPSSTWRSVRAALRRAPAALRRRCERAGRAAGARWPRRRRRLPARCDSRARRAGRARCSALNVALGEHLPDQPAATPAAAAAASISTALQPAARWPSASARTRCSTCSAAPRTAAARRRAAARRAGPMRPPRRAVVRNVVPAPSCSARFAACHSGTLFSATLQPAATTTRDLLGLPDDTRLDRRAVALRARAAGGARSRDRISTRYPHRAARWTPIADLIARAVSASSRATTWRSSAASTTCDRRPTRLAQRAPDAAAVAPVARAWTKRRGRPSWSASRRAAAASASRCWAAPSPKASTCRATRLIGAFIATLGLPQVNPVHEQMRQRMRRAVRRRLRLHLPLPRPAEGGAGGRPRDPPPRRPRRGLADRRPLRAPEVRGCCRRGGRSRAARRPARSSTARRSDWRHRFTDRPCRGREILPMLGHRVVAIALSR